MQYNQGMSNIIELKVSESAIELLTRAINDLHEAGMDMSQCIILLDNVFYKCGYGTNKAVAAELFSTAVEMCLDGMIVED